MIMSVYIQCTFDDFWISKTEITFAQYDVFAFKPGRIKRYSKLNGKPNLPAVTMSWHDATAYAKWLSLETGKTYRLPTEAEWEYAARAGTSTAYNWGDKLGSNHAHCLECGSYLDPRKPAPVASFKPNQFGLHDMHGNVWEWTCSAYDKDYGGDELHCINDQSDRPRVVRGGSWGYNGSYMRSAYRRRDQPTGNDYRVGIRLVLDQASVTPQ